MILDMILAKLGLVRAKHANRWAYQAGILRCYLVKTHRVTPHTHVKEEITDVLYQADHAYLRNR